MQEKKTISEQDDTLQEIVRGGGRISGKEGGLRLDVFKHDEIAYENGTDLVQKIVLFANFQKLLNDIL